MSNLVFLLIAIVLSGAGTAVILLRQRRPTTLESGINEWRREMTALAPGRSQPADGSPSGRPPGGKRPAGSARPTERPAAERHRGPGGGTVG